jgi:hypothetical protein
MTSGAVSIPLTFDGVDIQDLDGLHLEIVQGLNESPTVRGEDVTIPSADGQTYRPRRFHERRILLSGFVRGDGAAQSDRRADYRQNVKSMQALFSTTAAPADLVATLEDGTTATIVCRTLSVLSVERVPSEWADLSIELLALEDWAYEVIGS